VDGIVTARNRLQEKELLLDVRREVVQVHDLRHPRLGDVGQAGEFGLIAYLPLAEELFEVDRQGHQA